MVYRSSTFDVAIMDALDVHYGPGQGRLLLLSLLSETGSVHPHWAVKEALGAAVKENLGTRADETTTYVLRMDLGGGVTWTGRDLTIAAGLPETLLLDVEGRTLGSVINHRHVPAHAVIHSVTTSDAGLTLHTGEFRRVGLGDVQRRGMEAFVDWIRIAAGEARFNVVQGVNSGFTRHMPFTAALAGAAGFCGSALLVLAMMPLLALAGVDPEAVETTISWTMGLGTAIVALAGCAFHWLFCDMDGYDRITAEMQRRFGDAMP